MHLHSHLFCPAKNFNDSGGFLCGATPQEHPYAHHNSCIRLLIDDIHREPTRLSIQGTILVKIMGKG